MVLLGLSIFIASFSFLCYKHPPSSWPFLNWFRREAHLRMYGNEDATMTRLIEKELGAEDVEIDEAEVKKKEDVDRRAMPPPSTILRKPALGGASLSPSTTRGLVARAPSSIPTLTLDDSGSTSWIASFPAQNSIQRASKVRGSPVFAAVPTLQPPLRSTTFSSPFPNRSPLPRRTPVPATSSSLTIPPTHTAIPIKPSKKVQLTPGHSPLDWANYSNSPDTNLRGLPPSTPYLKVPPSLLRQYTGRKGKDAWTVLGGKVYNITPYMPYHPGGEPELMKAVGRDGTKLFGEVHPWVNWENMLEPCLIGIAIAHDEVNLKNHLEEMD